MVQDDMLNDLLKEIPTVTEAIKVCVRRSRLTEKQIQLELNIDSAHWSRIMNGGAFFPHDKFSDLHRICGNDIPARWLMLKFASQDQEEIERLRISNKQLQDKVEHLEQLLVKKERK